MFQSSQGFAGENDIGSKVAGLYRDFDVKIIEFESKINDEKNDDNNILFGLNLMDKNTKQEYYKLFNNNDCNNIKKKYRIIRNKNG